MATKKEKQKWEREFNDKYKDYIKRIEEKNFIRNKKLEIRKLKKENRKSVGLTTTKIISYYLFLIFNVVLIYAMVAMWHFADLSYLSVIISDIIGQILVYGIYAIRAYSDTKSEEFIKLERDKIDTLPDSIKTKLETLLDAMDNTSSNKNEYTEFNEESEE